MNFYWIFKFVIGSAQIFQLFWFGAFKCIFRELHFNNFSPRSRINSPYQIFTSWWWILLDLWQHLKDIHSDFFMKFWVIEIFHKFQLNFGKKVIRFQYFPLKVLDNYRLISKLNFICNEEIIGWTSISRI